MAQTHHSMPGRLNFRPVRFEELFGDDFEPADLSRVTRNVPLDGNSILIDKGDPANLFILKRGIARSTIFNDFSGIREIRALNINEMVGLGETLSNSHSMMRIHSVSPCLFQMIRRHDLLNILSDDPQLCLRLCSSLSEVVNDAYQSVVRFTP